MEGVNCDQVPGHLEQALTRLGEVEVLEPHCVQAEHALAAVQQACEALLAVLASAGSSQESQLQTVLLSFTRLTMVLQVLDAKIALVQASCCGDEFWCNSVLPLIDALLYSSRWEQALQQRGSLGKQLMEAAKCLVRDAIMPTLCKVAAGYHDTVGLLRTYSGVLNLGLLAAALFDYRSRHGIELGGRATSQPYVALNVTWHPIAKLWAAAPPTMRQQLSEQGMGASHLLKLLCGFLKQDMEALAAGAQGAPNIVKRSQFWLMLLNKLAVSFPEACSTAWETLLGWLINTRCKLGSNMESQSSGAGVSELLSKAAKCLILILNSMKCEDTLKVSVDRLRARMLAGHDSSDRQQLLAVPTLLAAIDLLEQASLMKPRVRLSCAQLVTGVVDMLIMPSCTATVLQDPSLLQRAAESVLVFLAATCSAATSGSGDSDCDAWLRTQRQLFLLALQPHPLVTEVLAHCWGDLIRLADHAIAQHHVAALHSLLQAAVMTETGTSWDASSVTVHLTTLLSVLLSSSPPGTIQMFVKAHLQGSASCSSDAAQLSCLCAALRVAALACQEATSNHFSPAVQATLGQLSTALSQYTTSALAQLAEQHPGSEEVLAFVRLLECTHLALAYLGPRTTPEVTPVLHPLVLDILGACSVHGEDPPCWAPAALRALASLLDLAGEQQLLTEAQLEALLPTLTTLLKHQETSALAAAMAAAFKRNTTAPTSLFHMALTETDPLLNFTALEAYAYYIKVCDKSLVMAMLPPGLLDPGTGVASEAFRAVLAQHVTRTLNEPLATTSMLQDHAAVLHGIAGSASVQLSSSAKLYIAKKVEAGDHERGAAVVAAAQGSAAVAVSDAITLLEQAMQAAGVPLDGDTVGLLQQSSARLGQILAAHGHSTC